MRQKEGALYVRLMEHDRARAAWEDYYRNRQQRARRMKRGDDYRSVTPDGRYHYTKGFRR